MCDDGTGAWIENVANARAVLFSGHLELEYRGSDRSSRVTPDILVDSIGVFEPTRNLFGRPLQLQLCSNNSRQRLVLHQFANLRATFPIPGKRVRPIRSIILTASVALQLAANRRRSTSQLGRDRPNRQSSHQATRNFLAFRKPQCLRCAVLLQWLDTTGLCEYPLYRGVAPIEQFGNLMNRFAFAPALPHQRLLTLRIVNPRSFHCNTSTTYTHSSVLHRPVESAINYGQSAKRARRLFSCLAHFVSP
jgi:hypothetical protein